MSLVENTSFMHPESGVESQLPLQVPHLLLALGNTRALDPHLLCTGHSVSLLLRVKGTEEPLEHRRSSKGCGMSPSLCPQ